jgi:signal transduction histidine kinase
MKLQYKIVLIALAVMIAVLIAGLASFHIIQESSLRQTDVLSARQALMFFCSNVISVVQTDTSQIQDVTLRSIVAYYFSSYARLLSGGNTAYALVQDAQYLFSNCPLDTLTFLGANNIAHSPLMNSVKEGQAEIPYGYSQVSGKDMIIATCSFQISGQMFQAIICMDHSRTTALIKQMRWVSTLILLTAIILVIVLLMMVLRPVLRPVQKLTQAAAMISAGDYHQRTGIRTPDEIGDLSDAFDRMTDSIEDKIRSLDDQLQKKQLLLAALTHELKTPMTAIIGFADNLLHMPLAEEQRLICAQNILSAGRHTESLARKLLDLISLADPRETSDNIAMRAFPASRLAGNLREILPDHVQINYETFELYGDETLLLSLVSNLVDNAIHASPEAAPVQVDITANGKQAFISVSDQGRGIPDEYIDLVTEPFFRVDRARSRQNGGVGLGLALCKMIAAYHGGSISIESKPEHGTCVTVTLLQFDNNSQTS